MTTSTVFSGIAGRAQETDREGCIPSSNWDELKSKQYLRLLHPSTVGGLDTPPERQLAIMEELAGACGSTYWTATVSGLLCAKLVATYGDAAVHRELLSSILDGSKLACFAIAERASGSDASMYTTTITPSAGKGTGLVLNGEKANITNAPTADIAVTLARYDTRRANGRPAWCMAFVDLHRPGTTRQTSPSMGLRGMPWGSIAFKNVSVDESAIVVAPFDTLSRGMTWGWLLVAVSSIAIADQATRLSFQHARERRSMGHSLGDQEVVQAQLAKSRTDIEACRAMLHRVGARWIGGDPTARIELGMLKVYATEMAVQALIRAVQIHGASALTPGHAIERLYRDAQMNVIGGFASNRLRETIAEDLTGDAPLYRNIALTDRVHGIFE